MVPLAVMPLVEQLLVLMELQAVIAAHATVDHLPAVQAVTAAAAQAVLQVQVAVQVTLPAALAVTLQVDPAGLQATVVAQLRVQSTR
jgi:hypothetical protein